MDEAFGAASAGASRALLQLCGEVLLTAPPARQPRVVRRGAAVGLELLDLLLNPDHVVRATEQLTLRDTVTLGRGVELDISLDRLSRADEERAMQLSALISGRMGGGQDDRPTSDGRIWLPLDTVPRPLSVPVLVSDGNGNQLTRPPQRKVRMALEAALYHILRESLRAHPDFEEGHGAVNALMRENDRARWLLQAALVAVCEAGPDTPRSGERRNAVVGRAPALAADGLTASQIVDALDQLVLQEVADDRTDRHRTLALAVLRDALVGDVPFLRLVDLVHGHDFVVASLDRHVRDQSVHYDLPDAEARPESVIESRYGRNRRIFDPREHNYTVHMLVPLPENLARYTISMRAPGAGPEQADGEVSLVGAIHYDDHPARTAIDAINTCADELVRTFGSYEWSARNPVAGADPNSDPDVRKVRFIASRAEVALDRIERIVDLQVQAAEELEVRWERASSWTVRQSVNQIYEVAANARAKISVARVELTASARSEVHPQALRAARALRTVTNAVEHRMLALQLVSNEMPGRELVRMRVDSGQLASRNAPPPRFIEIWATVSHEAQRRCFYGILLESMVLAALVYLLGSLLFGTAQWPLRLSTPLVSSGLANGPDAIVAVLLLVPAFAMTRRHPPNRTTTGALGRPARAFAFGSVFVLCTTAIMLASLASTDPDQSPAAPNDGLHPALLMWSFRVSLIFYLTAGAWAMQALVLRQRFLWRPKGLKALFGVDTFDRQRRRHGWLARLGRRLAYASKAPDAEFDLGLPSRAFPSQRLES